MSKRFGTFVVAAKSCWELKPKGTRTCSRLLKELKVAVMITRLIGPTFINQAQLLPFPFLVNAAELKAPFTLHKKMGPDLLKSGPDQFFLTVYTDNNQVRLMTEKSPNAHCLHC